MRFLLCLPLIYTLSQAEDFINKYEYGEMLYKNPRGISCEGCHGAYGEGKYIGKTIKNKKEITIFAPSIKNASLDTVKKSINIKKSVMPSYYLTDSEIDAIIYYIGKLNQKRNEELNKTKNTKEE